MIHLTRTDPARNMARFYTMALQPTGLDFLLLPCSQATIATPNFAVRVACQGSPVITSITAFPG